MLKDQNLLLEFWDEVAKAELHLRNLQLRGLIINSKIILLEGAYIRKELYITNIRVQGSKVYRYVNLKTLYKNDWYDKLVLRSREGVFIGYSDNTEKHLKIYAPDLGRMIFSSRLSVNESVFGGTVDLRLRGLQGLNRTLVYSPNCLGRGRLYKETAQEIQLVSEQLVSEQRVLTVEILVVKYSEDIPIFDEDENGNIQRIETPINYSIELYNTRKILELYNIRKIPELYNARIKPQPNVEPIAT